VLNEDRQGASLGERRQRVGWVELLRNQSLYTREVMGFARAQPILPGGASPARGTQSSRFQRESPGKCVAVAALEAGRGLLTSLAVQANRLHLLSGLW
jgi:hypothetical protein